MFMTAHSRDQKGTHGEVRKGQRDERRHRLRRAPSHKQKRQQHGDNRASRLTTRETRLIHEGTTQVTLKTTQKQKQSDSSMHARATTQAYSQISAVCLCRPLHSTVGEARSVKLCPNGNRSVLDGETNEHSSPQQVSWEAKSRRLQQLLHSKKKSSFVCV